MKAANLQKRLLEAIQDKFSRKQEMIQVLSDLLSVSPDGIYRRLRGDTLLTPDEITLLTTKFKLSLDTIIYGQSESLLFSYNPLSNPIKSFRDYLELVHHYLTEVRQIKGVQVYYASQEIPVFQYFSFPDLLRFKLFVYGLTSWNLDFLKGQKYHKRLIDPEAIELGAECVHLYNLIGSTDLWNLNIVDNTLNQIEYLATVELFEDPNEAFLLCDELMRLLDNAKRMAVRGKKLSKRTKHQEEGGAFDLYYNEMISTNNTLLVCTPLGWMIFTSINNPNFLMSRDRQFCEMIENWFKLIISRSTSISVHSAKNRDWFFNRLKKKVLAAKKKVKAL